MLSRPIIFNKRKFKKNPTQWNPTFISMWYVLKHWKFFLIYYEIDERIFSKLLHGKLVVPYPIVRPIIKYGLLIWIHKLQMVLFNLNKLNTNFWGMQFLFPVPSSTNRFLVLDSLANRLLRRKLGNTSLSGLLWYRLSCSLIFYKFQMHFSIKNLVYRLFLNQFISHSIMN